jgi:uncharacterized membrane protein (UPF0127 family)
MRARGGPGAGGSRNTTERGARGAKTAPRGTERRRVSRRSAAAYLLLVLVAGCTTRTAAPRTSPTLASAASAPGNPAVTVTFDGAPPLAVEVAATPAQRELGLMHRAQLPAGTGMLFTFPGESTGGFWMKNTLVPLSIAYVNKDLVVSTAEMVPCPEAAADCPTYEAAGPYTAAVETSAGFFPAHGVVAGTRMQVAGPTPAPQ